ncbi:MAG: hypothetical protein LN568_02515 [Rickettsia endosymbiont of Pseudomimeciton antennatum]|nr:hypothetical protein [Rickettsia endosymbiont of Pseudomimeciton antennatum]
MDHSSVEAEESLWSERSWVESIFLGKCYDNNRISNKYLTENIGELVKKLKNMVYKPGIY